MIKKKVPNAQKKKIPKFSFALQFSALSNAAGKISLRIEEKPKNRKFLNWLKLSGKLGNDMKF